MCSSGWTKKPPCCRGTTQGFLRSSYGYSATTSLEVEVPHRALADTANRDGMTTDLFKDTTNVALENFGRQPDSKEFLTEGESVNSFRHEVVVGVSVHGFLVVLVRDQRKKAPCVQGA